MVALARPISPCQGRSSALDALFIDHMSMSRPVWAFVVQYHVTFYPDKAYTDDQLQKKVNKPVKTKTGIGGRSFVEKTMLYQQ